MFGPVHRLAFVVLVAVAVYPVGTILRRIGFSPLWSVPVFVPIANVVAIWILALVDWPEHQSVFRHCRAGFYFSLDALIKAFSESPGRFVDLGQ